MINTEKPYIGGLDFTIHHHFHPKRQGRVRSRFSLKPCALLLLGAILASCEDPSGGRQSVSRRAAPGGDKPVEECQCIPEPAAVFPRTKWEKIALGETHVLAINEKGELYAWGSNKKGELGIGAVYESSTFPQRIEYVIIPSGTDNPTGFSWYGSGIDERGSGWRRKRAKKWIDIAAGRERSFAINEDGELYAWGRNDFEGLGFGGKPWSRREPKRPTKVGDGWVSVAAGRLHNIAIDKDGAIYTWGVDFDGNRTLKDKKSQVKSPTRTGTKSDWKFIAAGRDHSLAINEDGELYAWGDRVDGKLGFGNDGSDPKGADGKLTLRVGDKSDWKFAAAGTDHNLAVNEAGELYGWGDNTYFALGLGGTERGVDRIYLAYSPTKLDERTNWVWAAAGGKNSFAVNTAGELYGGGSEENGWKFMDKISSDRKIKDSGRKLIRFPSRIGDAANWKSVFVSNTPDESKLNIMYGFAMDTNQHLYSWGDNSKGQLGKIVLPLPSLSVH